MAGNWLLRGNDPSPGGNTVMIVNLKDGEFTTVLITNVIGDQVRIHVLDNPNDSLLSPGESVIRRGSKVFVEKLDPSHTAYGTFELAAVDSQ